MGSEKVVFLVIFIHPFENSGGYFFRGRLFWWILDINLQNLVRGYFSKFSLRALRLSRPLPVFSHRPPPWTSLSRSPSTPLASSWWRCPPGSWSPPPTRSPRRLQATCTASRICPRTSRTCPGKRSFWVFCNIIFLVHNIDNSVNLHPTPNSNAHTGIIVSS